MIWATTHFTPDLAIQVNDTILNKDYGGEVEIEIFGKKLQ